MMEDVEYKDKIMKNLVTALCLLITYIEVVMVWGTISIKGPKNCTLSRMNHLQVHVLVSEYILMDDNAKPQRANIVN